MACQPIATSSAFGNAQRKRNGFVFSPDEPIPFRITLLRKAAWRGFLVPTCKCEPPELILESAWLVCASCGAKTKALDGLERVAKTLDEALMIALRRTE